MKEFFTKFIIALFVALIIVLGVFWFIGKEVTSMKEFSFIKEKGQNSVASLSDDGFGQKTSEASRELYINFIAETEGKKLTQEEVDSIINNPELLEEIKLRVYTSEDIKTVVEQTNDSSSKYQGALRKINTTNVFEGLGTEPNILFSTGGSSAESERVTARTSLEKSQVAYSQIRNSLLEMEVPTDSIQNHVSLINIFEGLAKSTEFMIKAVNDPVYATPAIKVYLEATQQLLLL